MFNRVAKTFKTNSISSSHYIKYSKKETSYKINFNYTSKYSFSSFYKSQANSFVGIFCQLRYIS